ncbi:MAG: thioredoxin domain-containing protein [Syntrophorhabdaceae bacterium]|nr:thioredoxin domain-containing protein [Syntrophorhabdaceae bacterium]
MSLYSFLQNRRDLITAIIALLAIGVEVYYSLCEGGCSSLRGELFGIPLEYIGVGYMSFLIPLALMKKERLLVLSLSAGVGIEFYLIGFQIWYNTYCVYCLTFGGLLMVMFFLNIKRTFVGLSILSGTISLILFAIFFKGTATPLYASDTLVPSFGTGQVKVRLYTDYFCPPCRAMEPKAEPLILDLIKKNIITITFVDTPIYKTSPLYARYFLYILNEKKDIETAFFARHALIGASLEKIGEQQKLEEYLKNKGIKFKPFDVKPTFDLLNTYLKTDKVNSTPTCIIENEGKTERYTGSQEIIGGLEKIKKEQSKKIERGTK